MYPQRALDQLAAYKAALRQGIAIHRIQCVDAAARVAVPILWLDRAREFMWVFSPWPSIPLIFLVTRVLFPRLKAARRLARWGSLVFGVLRGISRLLRSRVRT